MSLTLATVADALIEFILSLLRDPEAAAEFERDPEEALAVRGLQHAGPADVAAVAPVIIERTQVVQVVKPVYVERDHSPVVREIKQVTTHFQWVDDRDTVVDQSVNQNIWAEGDVTQTFDNEAIVASGDDAVAAGGDAAVDKTWDESTTIEAGEDVNIGNQTDVEVIEESLNEDTDASTTTDESTVVVVEDSFDETSEQATADGSFNEDTESVTTTETVVDVTEQDAAAAQVVEQTEAAPESAPESAPAEEPAPDAVDVSLESAIQYVETEVVGQDDDGFAPMDAPMGDEGSGDDTF